MLHLDRRQRLALDAVYKLYRQIHAGNKKPDIYLLANSLTTLKNVLENKYDEFQLTKRLWQHIYEGLFDLFLTSFPTYVIIYNLDGEIQTSLETIIEPAIIEIHSSQLKRKTDVFALDLDQLNPLTKQRILQIWVNKSGRFTPEDFKNLECGEFCTPKNFIVGDEVLRKESEIGKERAYKRWWQLYWQAYCAPSPLHRQSVQKEMHTIEGIWGNLYY
jgi:hypothetical protein